MPQRLQSIRSYILYYGMQAEQTLVRYDLAIIDPRGRKAAAVRRLLDRGTLPVAYVSVLEVPQAGSGGPPPNALIWEGRPYSNHEFGNWVLDPRAPATKQRLLDLVEKALSGHHQGVFLDCIGDVEDRRFSPELRGELVAAAAWLVAEAARQYPSCLLVQNWGLHHLLPLTAQLIDAVCWEDFPYDQIGPVPTVHSGIRRLQTLQEEIGLRVLALNQEIGDAATYRQARDAADRCGFLWYGTTNYIDLPPRYAD